MSYSSFSWLRGAPGIGKVCYGTGYGRAYGEVPDREAANERLRVSDLAEPREAPARPEERGGSGLSRLWNRDRGAATAEREPVATVLQDDDDVPTDDTHADDGSPRDRARDDSV